MKGVCRVEGVMSGQACEGGKGADGVSAISTNLYEQMKVIFNIKL